jgi:predicted anti-sigma-YlaC factor YlaD
MARRADRACLKVRGHLSAALDGEKMTPSRSAAVAAHLMTCPGCRRFDERAVTLTRHLRVSALEPVPDLSGVILGHIAAMNPAAATGTVAQMPRAGSAPGLVRWSAAVVVLAVGLSSLASGTLGHTHVTPTHPVTPCTASLARHHMAMR